MIRLITYGFERSLSDLASVLGALGAGILAGVSVAALGAKAVLLVPALAVAAAMLLIPFSPLYTIIATVPINVEIAGPITVSRLAIVFAFIVAIWQGAKGQAPMPSVPRCREGYLALIFGAWILFGTFVVPSGVLSRVGPYAIFLIIYMVSLIYVDSPERLRTVLITLVTVGALQGLLVTAEALFNFVPFGGWQAHLAEERGPDEIRVVGSSAHPILLAGFFQVVLAAAAMLFLTTRELFVKLILLAVISLILVSWWYTFARSSWIGMGTMIFVAMVVISRPTRFLAIVGGTVLFFLLMTHNFSPSALINTIQNFGTVRSISSTAGLADSSESFQWRIENWSAAIAIWVDYPIFGVGIHQSPDHVLNYLPRGATAHQYIEPAVPHNMFLLILSEAGLPAFLMFSAFWITAFGRIRQAWTSDILRPYAMAILAMMCGLFATFMFNPVPREIWLVMGMAVALGRMAERGKATGLVNDPKEDPSIAGTPRWPVTPAKML